jgi:hypothetical protein
MLKDYSDEECKCIQFAYIYSYGEVVQLTLPSTSYRKFADEYFSLFKGNIIMMTLLSADVDKK